VQPSIAFSLLDLTLCCTKVLYGGVVKGWNFEIFSQVSGAISNGQTASSPIGFGLWERH